jgi:glutamate formiminotransferase
MVAPVLECVPNVSEGRSPAALSALADELRRVPGVRLLDLAPDVDHHRTVVTLAGDAGSLRAAVLTLFAWAERWIDLRHHRGVHPRIGAVDVVPFVPLAGATLEQAVAAARETAAAVAARFGLPVFLYEEAATRAHLRRLAAIRRGELPALAERLAQPEWAPDFGPAALHPRLGATVVGARFFLLAVNALLDTADVEVARAIAAVVREAAGGLPGVRALGLLLPSRGRAQVSMNLVDYRRTSLLSLLQRVAEEATARGVQVVETELVGLAPAEALFGPLRDLLRCPELGVAKLLEQRIATTDEGGG